MSRIRTAIFLGDLIRALGILYPTDDITRRKIAELLELQWEETLTDQSAEPALPDLTEEETLTDQSAEPVLIQTIEELPQQERDQPSLEIPHTTLPTSPSVLSDMPDWIASTLEYLPDEAGTENIKVVPLPQQTSSEEFRAPPPFEPLFLPRLTRGILSAALSTISGDGPPDIEGIVEILASGEYIRQLPKLPQLTLRRGVQLLVDKSDSMVPFTRDQVWMQDEILRVVGKDKVNILRFVGCPLWGAGTGYRKTWTTYRPPPPGTVVLLLSDLGISRPMFSTNVASLSEWLDFASRVRRSFCPLVAFVPYSPSRWPRHLINVLTMVQWDRWTTASTVHMLAIQHTM